MSSICQRGPPPTKNWQRRPFLAGWGGRLAGSARAEAAAAQVGRARQNEDHGQARDLTCRCRWTFIRPGREARAERHAAAGVARGGARRRGSAARAAAAARRQEARARARERHHHRRAGGRMEMVVWPSPPVPKNGGGARAPRAAGPAPGGGCARGTSGRGKSRPPVGKGRGGTTLITGRTWGNLNGPTWRRAVVLDGENTCRPVPPVATTSDRRGARGCAVKKAGWRVLIELGSGVGTCSRILGVCTRSFRKYKPNR